MQLLWILQVQQSLPSSVESLEQYQEQAEKVE